MSHDLTDRVILITGAAGGLGRSAARHLARCGAVVGVSDINAKGCDETAAMIRDAGGQAHSFPADLSSRDSFLAVADSLARAAGRIDAVVNNAALLVYEKIEDVREETVDRMIGIGLKAPMWGAQALLAHYDPQRGGVIINFASVVAYKGFPGAAVYSAIKGALISLTRVLAAELGPRNVRVNAVAPGSVPTPGALKYVDQKEYERRAATIPLRRIGREEDIDHALAYLLSKEASFVNGAVLNVDGGIVAAG